MCDLISRQAAIDGMRFECGINDDGLLFVPLRDVKMYLESLPSAQPEIIQCKDCKYSKHWYGNKYICTLWYEDGIDVFKDGFCNYAERREE